MLVKNEIEKIVKKAMLACDIGVDQAALETEFTLIERPKDAANGDWACTLAMQLARVVHKNPRRIAQNIIDNIPESKFIDSAEIAGFGFINFKLSAFAHAQVIKDVLQFGLDFAKCGTESGCSKAVSGANATNRINLEYISANPTGPMHVGHGRWAAFGSSLANIMRHAGYEVSEEYYINDRGVQMDNFGRSVEFRYLELQGEDVNEEDITYQGYYVKEIAENIAEKFGDKLKKEDAELRAATFKDLAYKSALENIKTTLERFGNHFDTWFSEKSLYDKLIDGKNQIELCLDKLQDKGLLFEKEDALWFKSSELGDEKDRVLIKADGDFTYFTSDIAYHINKTDRGFDHLIDIWGADHHGYIQRCEAAMDALGHSGSLEVILGQMVKLFRDGKTVRMSKRTGEMVSFQELIKEVGVDATRYLMLMCSTDQPINFDIEVAKKKNSSNPVYYVQYAHARICSILRKAQEEGIDTSKSALLDANHEILTEPSETALMLCIEDFAELLALAAHDRAPHRLTHYSEKLASLFHKFFTNCRCISDDAELSQARLALCRASADLLKLVLSLLGVSAPEKM
ncbi:MAG: arginine--tRNA ligase [Eggerthellaceae bacterium]|nr:arginine--tRNA ligase [Eggerthellaceae bacterium]